MSVTEITPAAWPSEPISFDSASHFLELAREAHAARNLAEFIAARKLLAVSLAIEPDVPPQLAPSARRR